jgi:hypothetical protein
MTVCFKKEDSAFCSQFVLEYMLPLIPTINSEYLLKRSLKLFFVVTTAYVHSEVRNELFSNIHINFLPQSSNLEYLYQFCIFTAGILTPEKRLFSCSFRNNYSSKRDVIATFKIHITMADESLLSLPKWYASLTDKFSPKFRRN